MTATNKQQDSISRAKFVDRLTAMAPDALRTSLKLAEDDDPYVARKARALLNSQPTGRLLDLATDPRYSEADQDLLQKVAMRIASGEFADLGREK